MICHFLISGCAELLNKQAFLAFSMSTLSGDFTISLCSMKSELTITSYHYSWQMFNSSIFHDNNKCITAIGYTIIYVGIDSIHASGFISHKDL